MMCAEVGGGASRGGDQHVSLDLLSLWTLLEHAAMIAMRFDRLQGKQRGGKRLLVSPARGP